MSLNNLKKTIVFSSPQGKNLIEAMIEDEAPVTGRTLSATLEFHLLHDALLPSNPTAAALVVELYSHKTSVGFPIAEITSYLAAGIDNYAKYSNAYDAIIQYCKFWMSDINAHFPDLYSVSYLRTQVNSIIDVMLQASTTTDNIYVKLDLEREAARMKTIIDDAFQKSATPQASIEIDALYFLETLSIFPQLKSFGRTYRLLSWLAKHITWKTTPKSRYELVQLFKEISREWD